MWHSCILISMAYFCFFLFLPGVTAQNVCGAEQQKVRVSWKARIIICFAVCSNGPVSQV